MSTKLSCLSAFAAVMFLLLPAACAAAEKEQKTTLDKVPKAVQDAIAKHLKGAKIEGIEVERENGKNVYEVEAVREGGKRVEVEFAEDGKVLEEEEGDDDAEDDDADDEDEDEDDEASIPLDEAPPAVRDAVIRVLGSNKLARLVKEREDGRTVYEAEYAVKGVKHEVAVGEDGKVIEEEHEVDVAKLPAAVTRAVTEKHKDGKITEAEMVKASGKTFYEVEVRVGKASRELKVSEDGKVEEDKADDDDDEEDEDEDEEEDDDGNDDEVKNVEKK